ncbi:MAG: SUMF1/EgtB/PvdO family nonheme iron enzyme [candidate division Zixibacteria bacterium]|nr:SUMF1/EgtB/PvdO family nonheme iron enzyme [candidate division Zixibacteria bacterium]
MEWVCIPAGSFHIGTQTTADPLAGDDETPAVELHLPVFCITRHPITNREYETFVRTSGYPAPGHLTCGIIPSGLENHPVTYVDWQDAAACCAWAGGRLPTEAEWEKAARGTDGRRFPWGDTPPDILQANFGNAIGTTTPVGRYPTGKSPYDALDMAGNVWEWCASLYRPYPYRPDDGREVPETPGERTVRGGTYLSPDRGVRCAARHAFYPTARDEYIGFRMAFSGQSPPVGPVKTPPPSRLLRRRPVSHRSGLPKSPDLEWIDIPSGVFLMGSGASEANEALFHEETPQHDVYLPAFCISRVPVTNAQYRVFVEITGYPAPGHWTGGAVSPGMEHHPVVYVDWQDAAAHCVWAGGRLPTEAEWEKAARGTDGRRFPWGDTPPDPRHAQFGQTRCLATTPVDAHSVGASEYGALDMAGNVWEWCASLYFPYPYPSGDGREEPDAHGQRVLRGGSFASPDARYLRCAARSRSHPARRRDHIGFRVARTP